MKFVFAPLFCAALVSSAATHAAEIRVLSSGAVKEAYLELTPQFEAATGHKVVTVWSSTVLMKKDIVDGAQFDLVIIGAPEVDDFISKNKALAGSRVDLMKVGVGMAVKEGAPKPDVSSAAKVKEAVLAAKKVAYSSGPSGTYIQNLFGKLGIAEEAKTKTLQTQPGMPVAGYLRRGEVDFGFQQVSELVHEGGIAYLGPLPAEIQNYTLFSSGVPSVAKEPAAAKAFQAWLAAPEAGPVKKKHGLEGGPF
jgi:molybdate transport system substrate-binding protein